MVQPIVTPEAVVLDFDRAGVASRTLAMLVDFLALLGVWLVLLIVTLLTTGGGDGSMALFYVLFSVLLVFAWFWGWETFANGRTPGKMALGLRVVGEDGTPVRFQQAFLRAAVGFVDFLLIPIGCIAVVTILVSHRDQRLGDMAAGTLVVRERSARTLVAPAVFRPPPGYERYAASLDVAALDAESYEVVRSFLLRAHEFSPSARDHMAVRLANAISRRMNHVPAQFLHPRAFLDCVAAAWQHAHGLVTIPWGQAAPAWAHGPPAYGAPPGYPPQPGYGPPPGYGQPPAAGPSPGPYGRPPGPGPYGQPPGPYGQPPRDHRPPPPQGVPAPATPTPQDAPPPPPPPPPPPAPHPG